MADHPSDEWTDSEGGVRVLKSRAQSTFVKGDPEEQEGVTNPDRATLAGGEKYPKNVPNSHHLTKDPDEKKSKAVSSKKAENKAVASSAEK